MKYSAMIMLLSVMIAELSHAAWYPERRRDQFPKEDAYLVVPLPYSYPGIGEGLFILGNASNVFETTSDVLYIEVVGDATGRVVQFDEVPVLADELLLSVQWRDINRAVINQYAIRGMNGSDGTDYTLLDVSQADHAIIRLDYSSDERRFNYYLTRSEEAFTLDAILDPDGNSIPGLSVSYSGTSTTDVIGLLADLTDDYMDPRRGFRLGLEYIDHPLKGVSNDPDFYVLNYNFSYYFPLRKADTLVLNYFQSDAHVRAIGNINESDIRNELNLSCGGDPVCLQTEQSLVNSFVSARTYGTAASLGGLERLRSYPQGRFSGGHAAFLAAEYRWNLTDEATPFNYFFWKDVRTGKQIAFFAEAGSVSEVSSDLWQEQRYTYGIGFRLLAASGSVYRADFSTGDEGTEVAIFFFYPW
ncbi:MAG: BamA/TamA family outer membrane protein [Gammaproteobacteria bacterium]|nr:BamA/TamA family outer membrane protein [Gammaproteobacteria bacterium]